MGGCRAYIWSVSLTSLPREFPVLQVVANRSPTAGADPEPDRDFVPARAGDTNAFVRLVRHHQARIFSLALRLTGGRADAEELAQDAFLGLYSRLPHLESALHARYWLRRTLTHRSIDPLGSRARRPESQSMDLRMLEGRWRMSVATRCCIGRCALKDWTTDWRWPDEFRRRKNS